MERSVTTNWLSVSASAEILTGLLGSTACNHSEINIKIVLIWKTSFLNFYILLI